MLVQELNTLGVNPEPSQNAKVPYLIAVCQETLRIYSIAMAGFVRVVKNPIEIMGYKLPEKKIIIPSIYPACTLLRGSLSRT